MEELITSISSETPAALSEVRRLGQTLKRRAVDDLAYFQNPGTSNGPKMRPENHPQGVHASD